MGAEDFKTFIEELDGEIEDAASWPSPRSVELAQLLFKAILVYGILSDGSRIVPLTSLYRHCMQHLEYDVRHDMYARLRNGVMEGKSSINTLMPYLFVETEPAMVAEAAIDYCMVVKPDPDDVLSACRRICNWVAQDRVANRGALFGGLLCLGDARAMALLDELKWTLTGEEVGVAARSCSAMPTIAGVEFWLSWAEEIVDRTPSRWGLFGHVTSGLALLEKRRGVEVYRAIERNFGYPAHPRSTEAPLKLLEELTPAEVASRYADRMYALERAEEPLKVMSMVLLVFGLEPRASVEERYVIQ
jgi:hypothetical protein